MDAPAAYRLIIGFFRLVVRVYFRRVEVTGRDELPADGGGILVAWHPNGLVDPGLILTAFPRRVVMGARAGLFSVPVLGTLMRAIGTVPIHRPQDGTETDPEARRLANRQSLEGLAGAVADGSFACLFPEGTSHDHSRPLIVKTGAANLYYLARRKRPDVVPRLIPVGLHYDDKTLFRSEAHVAFHPALVLPTELDRVPADDEEQRAMAGALTELIERALHETAHATDTWELHYLLRRTRKLVRAERARRAGADPGRPNMTERTLGFARVWHGWRQRQMDAPEEVYDLEQRIREYDADLRALGLDDHLLDANPRWMSPWLGLLVILQVLGVFVLLPPLIVLGYLVNLPPLAAIWLFTRGVARKKKDEATLQVLIGVLLFPLTWLLAGAAAWLAHEAVSQWWSALPETGPLAALTVMSLGALGGALALRYVELVRETTRGLRIRFVKAWRRSMVDVLRDERGALYDQVMSLAEGLSLPGEIEESGRVVTDSEPGFR